MFQSKSLVVALGLAAAAVLAGSASAQSAGGSQTTTDSGLAASRYSQSFAPNQAQDNRVPQRERRYIGRYIH